MGEKRKKRGKEKSSIEERKRKGKEGKKTKNEGEGKRGEAS